MSAFAVFCAGARCYIKRLHPAVLRRKVAKVLAERGVRVLVFERETAFRDRVRGEQMHPWGVTEARKLGLYELLLETCGSEVRYWSGQLVGFSDVTRRDLFETSPQRAGSLNFYHPDMQSVVTAAAEKAGATILRGARVAGLLAETPPGVRVRLDANGEHVYRARLVVGADGRSSMTRQWGGFRVEHDPAGMSIAGLRIDGLAAPEDTMSGFVRPAYGMLSLTVPLGMGDFACMSAATSAMVCLPNVLRAGRMLLLTSYRPISRPALRQSGTRATSELRDRLLRMMPQIDGYPTRTERDLR
jgi:2-polyprenyl-6-methoxyphenol hydroxylase-like FAD-dependent oxidoreductase